MPIAKSAAKAVFADVFGGLIRAPVFWYTRGALDAASYCLKLVARQWKALAVGVWVMNLFVPMYGQRDAAGMAISFFMRVVQIFVRFMGFILSVAGIVLLYAAYLIIPLFVFIQLFRQLVALISP